MGTSRTIRNMPVQQQRSAGQVHRILNTFMLSLLQVGTYLLQIVMNFDVVFEFYLLRFILHKVNLLKMNGKIGKYAAVKCIAVDPH